MPIGRRGIRVAALLALVACGSGDAASGPGPAGDLSDTSYYGARGVERVNAKGESVRFEQFEGRFLWAEYAAPWCPPCTGQAVEMRQLGHWVGGDVEVVTVMTSDLGGYGHPATRATAQQWASQHGLPSDRVIAADLTAMRIPRHVLYSPKGQVLFEQTGTMTALEIRSVIDERSAAWRDWTDYGARADWMRAD